MNSEPRVLVTGAGGFIGHHLVTRLKKEGHWVRGVDIKSPEYEASMATNSNSAIFASGRTPSGHRHEVYTLAADMGGIGYITGNHADIARNNILINAHMLEAARQNAAVKFLYSSSACVYAGQAGLANVTPLKEEDAIPRIPSRAMDGRSSTPKNYAATISTIMVRNAHRALS